MLTHKALCQFLIPSALKRTNLRKQTSKSPSSAVKLIMPKEYVKEATALSHAETLCWSMLDQETKQEIEFFKSIKAGLCKCGGRIGITSNEINSRIMTLLEQAIEQEKRIVNGRIGFL